MRILFWSETFWPRTGGVENLAARLLPALRARGYEFAVVTWENTELPDVIHYQEIPIYRFPFFSGRQTDGLGPMLEYRRQVTQLKRGFAPDLVHVNSYGPSVLFHLNTTGAHRVPALVTLHQALPDDPVGHDTLLGHLLRNADWVTACSTAVLAHTRRLVSEIMFRSSLIYNALEVPAVDPQPIPFDPPRCLFIGRLVADKGLDRALTAFADLFAHFPTARLVIAGDGPERENLERQTTELRLTDSVEFLGAVPPAKVPHLINEATLVLIPSRLEGFGLVALEAAWMARPVVATRVGGLPELVVHKETGLLVESGDRAAMASAISSLLHDRERAVQMGQSGRLRAQNLFSWERHVDAYDALYQKLARQPRELRT